MVPGGKAHAFSVQIAVPRSVCRDETLTFWKGGATKRAALLQVRTRWPDILGFRLADLNYRQHDEPQYLHCPFHEIDGNRWC